jgi:hypothetical protein
MAINLILLFLRVCKIPLLMDLGMDWTIFWCVGRVVFTSLDELDHFWHLEKIMGSCKYETFDILSVCFDILLTHFDFTSKKKTPPHIFPPCGQYILAVPSFLTTLHNNNKHLLTTTNPQANQAPKKSRF